MTLTMEQLRGLALLGRAWKQAQLAKEEQYKAEQECWELGISDRQIGAIVRESGGTVNRRRRRRTIQGVAV